MEGRFLVVMLRISYETVGEAKAENDICVRNNVCCSCASFPPVAGTALERSRVMITRVDGLRSLANNRDPESGAILAVFGPLLRLFVHA